MDHWVDFLCSYVLGSGTGTTPEGVISTEILQATNEVN